ncbi:MAG: response regulator [Terracidiphilus sp.]|nr:response regulator [Terracidiphilus sp.]
MDDDELFRTRLGRALEARGWEVFLATNSAQAVSLAQDQAPGLAIIDLRLEGESGLDIVRALRPLDPTMFILMLTGWGSIATALDAVRGGADHYLSKPVDADQIIAVFKSLPAAAAESEAPAVPSLARVEWEHIQRVLTDCGGNISLAAKQLGIHRRSLQRKLSKYPPRL